MERRRLQYMRDLLSRRSIFVFVDVTNGKRRIGEVVEINNLTTWVKIMIGAKTAIVIKRHNVKHHMTHYKMGEYYESIHTETGD